MRRQRLWAIERGTLWAMELDGPASTAPAAPPLAATGFTCSEVTPEDAASLAVAMGLPDAQSVRERFASGRRCFAAYVEDTIAAYGWVSTDTERIGELERSLRMLPGEAYIWDCATLPAYRRRGLYGALLCHIVAVLRGEGMRRVWIGASLDNAPSLRGFHAAGFHPVIRLAYLRVLGVRHVWLLGEATAPRMLVAAARRALSVRQEPLRGAGAIATAAGQTAATSAPTREYPREET